ncbi:uncharacterized protein LOC118202901, partial [Stegodyphus dumicola]|uniref:uncharacterized protein LOC118202901 n=1 Tax=Stegodyphus dumicola TaxID=202533 RepID=UPI0015AFB6DD
MNSAQSNSNMQRSAVETNVLEQIRKQGLSISIVSGDSSSSRSFASSVAKETRSKPNVVIMDKSKVSPRSIPVENKTAATHARSIPNSAVETRASSSPSVVSTSQSYHENKTLVPQRANNQVVSEVKSFSAQTWCNPNVSTPSEKKPQGNANRVTQTIAVLPETKSQGSRQVVSVLPETKPLVSRNSQNAGLLPENKAPVRVNQIPTESKGQPSQGRIGQCHQLLNEGKVAPNQSRISVNTSSAETKIFNNQNWNQNSSFSGVNEHKTTNAQQRHIVQMVADPKTCNKLSTNRPVEGKVSNQNRGNQNVKLASDTIATIRIRPSFPKTTDRKTVVSQAVTPTVLPESTKINPFRKVTEETSLTLGEKSFPVVEGKSVALKQAPVRNFIIASEGQSVAHSKNSQTVTVQSDGKIACQVVKNSSVALEPSQKSSSYF